LFNVQLMAYAGENGVAAYGVIMYIDFIFLAAFIGYAMGTAPVISYHYGAQNHGELQSLLRKSLMILLVTSVGMFVFAEAAARPLAMIFASYDPTLLDITVHGFHIYSISFLFVGFTIFGSSFFTALNNGLVSAIISFVRTLIFEVVAVLILPALWGIDGIWWAVVIARGLSIVVTFAFILVNRKKYQY